MSEPTPAELRAGILADFERLMERVAHWRMSERIDIDVTMPQARCVLLVGLYPGISITQLATHMHVGLPAASGLVERLVEHGYVERNVDPDDRRHQLVTLAARGRELIDRFHELSSERLDEMLAGLSPAELRGLRVGIAALAREAAVHLAPPVDPRNAERTPA